MLQRYQSSDLTLISEALKAGLVGALAADTMSGLSGKVDPLTAERLRNLKERPLGKGFVILIPDITYLEQLGIDLTPKEHDWIWEHWPGPHTLVVKSPKAQALLGEEIDTLAIRQPKDPWLQSVLELTGPLFSTSANKSGEMPLQGSRAIESVFGNKLDFIVEHSAKKNPAPSTISELSPEGTLIRLR